MAIARGNISHSVMDEIKSLFFSFFGTLDNVNKINEFEQEFAKYANRRFAHAYPFARTALYFTLKQLNLPKKSKIVLPSITIKAFIDVVLELDYEPVFVDSDPRTGFADLRHLENILQTRPQVLVLTYLFGIVPDLLEVKKLIEKYPVIIIEDFSQCLNGRSAGIKVGSLGDFAIYSCSAIKDIDTYGGGILFHDSEQIANIHYKFLSNLLPLSRRTLIKRVLLSFIRNILSRKVLFTMLTFPLIKLSLLFGSDRANKFVGNRPLEPITGLPKEWFMSYSSVQANMGLKALQVVKLTQEKRIQVGKKYENLDKNFLSLQSPKDSESVYWQYIVYPSNFEKFRKFLASRGIDCSQTSLVNVSNLKLYGWENTNFKALWMHEKAVYVPCYSRLNSRHVKRVSRALLDFRE
jgi:perosamine synthetase